MRTFMFKITLLTLLLTGLNAFSNTLSDEGTEGRSANVDDCLKPGGACYNKLRGILATDNQASTLAIIDGIMNEGKPLVDLKKVDSVK